MPKAKHEADVADEHEEDGHLPGKNRNSFLVFQAEYRAELKQKHPDLPHSEVQGKISDKWSKMDAEHKQVRTRARPCFFCPKKPTDKYEVLAAKEFVEYVRKLAEQKESHPELFDRSNTKANKAAGKRRGPGITGYILYVQERMPSLKGEKPELKQTDLTREIGKEWKEMSDDKKATYNAAAKKKKEDLLKQEADAEAPAVTSPEKKRKSPDDDSDKPASKAKKAKTDELPKVTPKAAAADSKKKEAPKKEAAKPAATPKKEKKAAPADESDEDSSVSGSQRSSQRANKGKGGRK